MEWALRIKVFRQHMGYKQTVAAEILGVSQATLSKWESGVSKPTTAAKSIIFRTIARDDDNALVARHKFWIDRSNERHVLYNLRSGKALAISPASRRALGVRASEGQDLFIQEIVHESQQIIRERTEALVATWDKDVLGVSMIAMMYDAPRHRVILGQHNVTPLFVGSTIYTHAYLTPAELPDPSAAPAAGYTIHTIYGDELVTSGW